MLKRNIFWGMLVMSIASTVAFATEGAKNSDFEGIAETLPPEKIDWEKASKQGGKGNVRFWVNSDGTPKLICVIGVASVSKSLDPVDAELDAQEEAEFSAKEAFALWLGENFSVVNRRDRKTIVIKNGSYKNSGDRENSERSETITINTKTRTQAAAHVWRGMSVYATKHSNGKYIAVWRWSATEQRLAKLVEVLTRDGNIESSKQRSTSKVNEHDWIFR